jgi:hypothetical protein
MMKSGNKITSSFVYGWYKSDDLAAKKRYQNQIAFADGYRPRKVAERRSRNIPCSPTGS